MSRAKSGGYHRATEATITRVLADAREHEVMAPYHAYWRHAAEVLLGPWHARGHRRTLLHAAIALALSFDTWRTLTREQGLTDEQAVEVALRLAGDPPAAGSPDPPRPRSRTTQRDVTPLEH